MKKILFLIALAFMFSCSSDDDTNVQDGYMKVLYMSRGSAPGEPMTYFIYYGTRINDDQVTTEVSEEVYEYYRVKFEANPSNKPRWRGMITED